VLLDVHGLHRFAKFTTIRQIKPRSRLERNQIGWSQKWEAVDHCPVPDHDPVVVRIHQNCGQARGILFRRNQDDVPPLQRGKATRLLREELDHRREVVGEWSGESIVAPRTVGSLFGLVPSVPNEAPECSEEAVVD
jgi:hypothetical protein